MSRSVQSRFVLTTAICFLLGTSLCAQTPDELDGIMRRAPKTCRSEYAEFQSVSYSQCAGKDLTSENQCADEVARRNAVITRWNQFVQDCRTNRSSTQTDRQAPPVSLSQNEVVPHIRSPRLQPRDRGAGRIVRIDRNGNAKSPRHDKRDRNIVDRQNRESSAPIAPSELTEGKLAQ
jgi:hypothetical protein